MKLCPKCNKEYGDEYKFCKKCGVSLVLYNKQNRSKSNAKSKSNGFIGKKVVVFTVAMILIVGSVLYNNDSFRYKLYDIGIVNPSTTEEQFRYGYSLVMKNDYKNAFRWVEQSANAGDFRSQYMLGVMYKDGDGVEKDDKESFKWYMKSAEQGMREAQYEVGRCYEDGIGALKNRKLAKEWFKKSAEAGHVEAQAKYAFQLYLDNDYKRSLEYFRKSADAGNSYAQLMVGEYYVWGYGGVGRDYKKAIEWFEKSAKGGNTTALLNIGRCYQDGEYGVVKDLNKAAYYYNASAEKGNSMAMRRIAYCYYFGEGVDWDQEKAKEWLRKEIKKRKTEPHYFQLRSDDEEIESIINDWKRWRKIFKE